MAQSSVELVVFNAALNKSVALKGELLLQPDNSHDNKTLSSADSSSASSASHQGAAGGGRGGSEGSDDYDASGALMYVVVVMVVYSLSMVFLVVLLARRKNHNKSLDQEVDRYIKGLQVARQQAKSDDVRRIRLRWPGNFIGLRFSGRSGRADYRPGLSGVRTPAGSTDERDSDQTYAWELTDELRFMSTDLRVPRQQVSRSPGSAQRQGSIDPQDAGVCQDEEEGKRRQHAFNSSQNESALQVGPSGEVIDLQLETARRPLIYNSTSNERVMTNNAEITVSPFRHFPVTDNEVQARNRTMGYPVGYPSRQNEREMARKKDLSQPIESPGKRDRLVAEKRDI